MDIVNELTNWLKQQGFQRSDLIAAPYFDKRLINVKFMGDNEEFPLYLSLRVELPNPDYGINVMLMLNSYTTFVFVNRSLESVSSVEKLKELLDEVVDVGKMLSEKTFARLSEFRMTGM